MSVNAFIHVGLPRKVKGGTNIFNKRRTIVEKKLQKEKGVGVSGGGIL